MVTVKDVPADLFIEKLAKYLKSRVPTVKPPEWALFVKTGPNREKPPENPDWWYVRAASILRKLYLANEPMGIETFRVIYGGLQRSGFAPPHFKRSGGSAIRKILQQLEAAGLIMKIGNRGRIITPQGRSLLDRVAWEVFQELVKQKPGLAKYGSQKIYKTIGGGEK